MDHDFWHQRWAKNEISFHKAEFHPSLLAFFPRLAVPVGGRIFVPLCGKSRDMLWLLDQGYSVVGAELSQVAVEQFFAALDLVPEITIRGELRHYAGPTLEIWVGDIFALTAEQLGPVAAVYDRAALVALPPTMRAGYMAHLVAITAAAPQLLISLAYEQSRLDGPPFAVLGEEITPHYQPHYHVTQIDSQIVQGGLRGGCPAEEQSWLLTPRL